MTLDNYKLKLNKNGDSSNIDIPQYSITYRTNSKKPNHASYDILSALKENNDVIIEISTDLFFDSGANKEDYVNQFLNAINSLNIKYIHRKIPSAKKPSIFGFSIESKKKVEAHEIIAYVPDGVWAEGSLRDNLPISGARYYITKEPMGDTNILNDIRNMSEEEKAGIFRLIIFDLALLGQIGINSSFLEAGELNRLLGL